MYAQGQGVEPDDAEAARWRLKAAEQGDADEQFMLGNMYARGWGVEQVYAKASHWWRKAAEQGNAYAQFNLGDMYFLGRGVQQDHAKARRWWRKAADQGNAAAQFNLGLQYAKGVGVPQDDAKAVRPRGSLENRPMRITSKAANGVSRTRLLYRAGAVYGNSISCSRLKPTYTGSTWAEDTAPQGCDRSAVQGPEWRGGASRPLRSHSGAKALNPGSARAAPSHSEKPPSLWPCFFSRLWRSWCASCEGRI